jgi:hypothetical protein
MTGKSSGVRRNPVGFESQSAASFASRSPQQMAIVGGGQIRRRSKPHMEGISP